MQYSIYHIPGIKIGCTDNLNRRLEQQGYSNAELLEEHDDIYVASDREMQLQKQYGYRVDSIPYYESVKRWGSKAGKIGGKNAQKTLKKNKLGIYSTDINLRREWQKLSVISVKEKYGKQHYIDMGKKSHINGHKGAEASSKKVIGFDKKGNKTEYNSISDVARKFNTTHAAISNNLRGLTKFTKAHTFEYA